MATEALRGALDELGRDVCGKRGRRRILRTEDRLPSGGFHRTVPGSVVPSSWISSCRSVLSCEYIGADGEKHRPIMIHRVAFGSIERFIGILIEHFAGAFPTWLAPVAGTCASDF